MTELQEASPWLLVSIKVTKEKFALFAFARIFAKRLQQSEKHKCPFVFVLLLTRYHPATSHCDTRADDANVL